MTKSVPFLLQGKNIILVIDGQSHTISKDTHVAYEKIVAALKEQAWDVLRDLVEPKKVLLTFANGYLSIIGDEVLWKGQPFHGSLSSRMIEMYQEGFPIDPMVRFMENLMKNPSKRSVDQLYGFLEKNKLPITEDGHFLAYKKVRDDYMDIHSGTISNHIGAVVEMDRNQVDDNPNSHCSTGLHFCSESYLEHFGDRDNPVMILKINPADVVSIPSDYNGAKGRCMRYEVVAQVAGHPGDAFTRAVDTAHLPTPPAPVAGWPFDEANADFGDEADSAMNEVAPSANAVQLYDLVRVHGGVVEYYNQTLAEARELVARNVRQKKAMLKIVLANTDQEYR
jgi:hypothetical protein